MIHHLQLEFVGKVQSSPANVTCKCLKCLIRTARWCWTQI